MAATKIAMLTFRFGPCGNCTTDKSQQQVVNKNE